MAAMAGVKWWRQKNGLAIARRKVNKSRHENFRNECMAGRRFVIKLDGKGEGGRDKAACLLPGCHYLKCTNKQQTTKCQRYAAARRQSASEIISLKADLF